MSVIYSQLTVGSFANVMAQRKLGESLKCCLVLPSFPLLNVLERCHMGAVWGEGRRKWLGTNLRLVPPYKLQVALVVVSLFLFPHVSCTLWSGTMDSRWIHG